MIRLRITIYPDKFDTNELKEYIKLVNYKEGEYLFLNDINVDEVSLYDEA